MKVVKTEALTAVQKAYFYSMVADFTCQIREQAEHYIKVKRDKNGNPIVDAAGHVQYQEVKPHEEGFDKIVVYNKMLSILNSL